jgi:hypothetical protein
MTPRRIVVIVVVVIVVMVNREINVRMGTSDERWGAQYKKQGTNRKETAYERGEGEGAAGEGIKKHWRRSSGASMKGGMMTCSGRGGGGGVGSGRGMGWGMWRRGGGG